MNEKPPSMLTYAEWLANRQPATWSQVQEALLDFVHRGVVTADTLMYFGPLCPGCAKRTAAFKGIGMWLTGAHCTAVYSLCSRCAAEMEISESRAQIMARTAEAFLERTRAQEEARAKRRSARAEKQAQRKTNCE